MEKMRMVLLGVTLAMVAEMGATSAGRSVERASETTFAQAREAAHAAFEAAAQAGASRRAARTASEEAAWSVFRRAGEDGKGVEPCPEGSRMVVVHERRTKDRYDRTRDHHERRANPRRQGGTNGTPARSGVGEMTEMAEMKALEQEMLARERERMEERLEPGTTGAVETRILCHRRQRR